MNEDVMLQQTIRRLNARAWGISVGLLMGLVLFIATNLLVLRGGPQMGQHLSLLSIYFPGYSVSFAGSVIGFIYAFVLGYGIGRVIGRVYNRLVA